MILEKLAKDMNGRFTKEATQMATTQMKRCWIISVSRAMKIKMMRHSSMPIRQATIKNLANQEDMGEQ